MVISHVGTKITPTSNSHLNKHGDINAGHLYSFVVDDFPSYKPPFRDGIFHGYVKYPEGIVNQQTAIILGAPSFHAGSRDGCHGA
jgi:hypothetical protein